MQPTFLYGCASWTLTREREHQIQTVQRKMLRQIIGTKRLIENGVLEEWVAWMIRATQIVDETMQKFNIQGWVEEAHRRKYRWAGRVAQCSDDRWTKNVLTWSTEGSRRAGRPEMRWTNSLNNFFGEDSGNITWMTLAEDTNFWNDFEESYVQWIRR